jgi:hypothetical protein
METPLGQDKVSGPVLTPFDTHDAIIHEREIEESREF